MTEETRKKLEGFFELAFPLAAGRPTFSEFKQSVLDNLTITEGDTPVEGFIDVTQHLPYFGATQKHFAEMLRILRISSLPRGQVAVLKRLYEVEKQNWLVMDPLGSGKTLVLAVQIARAAYDHIKEEKRGLAAVALLPTRETAKALEALLQALTFNSGVSVLAAIGGEHSAKQLAAMAYARKPHILIGTPGKIVDLLKATNATPYLSTRFFVLDGADDMLSHSKLGDVEFIRSYFKKAPVQAYPSSFRAPLINSFYDVFGEIPRILKMADRQHEGARLNEKWKVVTSDQLKDVVSLLTDIFPELNLQNPLIIFCTTRVATNAIHKQLLDSLGQENRAVFKIHRGMSENERQRALDGFQGPAGLILVATYLAALGPNLTRLTQVLNIGVPLNMTLYIQACGRAARSGKDVAIIRTAILERDRSVFTQYRRWHMVDRKKDDDETGLWLNEDKYEGGREEYMVTDELQKAMRKLALERIKK